MKTLITSIVLASSFAVSAANVKVTSFNFIRTSTNYGGPLAELCGHVEGATSTTFINVKVDPKTNRPANYNTLAGGDGGFCVAVITYRGTADVSIMGEKSVVTAKAK